MNVVTDSRLQKFASQRVAGEEFGSNSERETNEFDPQIMIHSSDMEEEKKGKAPLYLNLEQTLAKK